MWKRCFFAVFFAIFSKTIGSSLNVFSRLKKYRDRIDRRRSTWFLFEKTPFCGLEAKKMGPENELEGYFTWHFTLSVLAIFSKIKRIKEKSKFFIISSCQKHFLFFCDN